MPRIISILVVLLLIAVVHGCSTDDPVTPTSPDLTLDKGRGGNPNPRIIPPHARPHGKSYEEWAALWWQWLWSAPEGVNPGLDTTGEFVDWDQSGKVWFLAPNYGLDQSDVRVASIPKGTMLFIDVAGFFTSPFFEGDDTLTIDELFEILEPFTDGISNIEFEVDGVAFDITSDYRIQSGPFDYTFPVGGMFGVPAGDYEMGAVDAYHVMLAPLSRGEHVIRIFSDLGEGYGTSEVVFYLTVE
jgi:hypothetical protein